ncbi:spectrin repeat-containing domain protein [Teladorsagia circumcincta]|uniref:Spectrin repeat-containing domain protein n=1 Tax=Teladorsagia circumcincta TaxID=45464 RepID=A0A2G9TRC8_TELCI|nr:spectrin repeat-containing domain protein [Teladorsagia circumcincta]
MKLLICSVSTLNAAAQRLLRDDRNTDVLEKMNEMNKEWRELNEILESLTLQMERAKADAEKVGRETEQWMGWLEDVESQLATTKPTGGLPETAEVQLDDFLVLRAEELCVDREKKLQLALEEAVALDSSMRDTAEWLAAAEQRLAAAANVSRVVDVLEKQLEENEKWVDEVAVRKQLMAEQQAAGTRLQYYCEKKDAIPIKNGLVSLKHRFEKVASRTADRTKALLESSAFDDAVLELESWIDAELMKNAATDGRVLGDIDTVKVLAEEHRKREAERSSKQRALDTIITKNKWSQLEEASRARSGQLEDAIARATDFNKKVHEILDWLVEVEGRLAVPNVDLRQALTKVEDIKVELSNARENRDLCLEAGRSLQAKCHPRAEQPLKHWLRVVENRWKEVEERASERESSLLDQQQQEKEREEALFELLEFVAHKREELNRMLAQALPQDLESVIRALLFDSKITEAQTY